MWFRRGYDKVEAAKETSRLVEDGAGSSTANMEIVAASNGEEEDKEEKPNLWVDRVITALFVVVFMTVIFFTTAGRRNRWEERKKADIANTMTYRPVCQSHIKARKVKVLQTGLQEPTLKWAPQECAFSPSVQTYRSVDAEIQVELNMFAHPDRLPIMGFGGAFTEASALNFNSLTEPGREMVMKLLFGKEEGLGYALGRVHINSCDFSLQSYAYDMTDGDFELEDFSVQHDIDVGMVDMMKRARTFYDWNDDGIKYYASPWSPPPWMKAPTPDDPKGALHAQNMTNSAQPICLRDYDRPGGSPYAKAWALYFAKFIEHYKELGLDIFAVTIQNEPEFPAPWDACAYTDKMEADFLGKYLGPQLRESHPDVKIIIFDHNKDHAPRWIETILSDPDASQYVNGTAIHWYAGGMDRLLDGGVGTPNMHRVMSQLDSFNVSSDHLVFGSEACHCPTTGYAGGDINVAWARAERYAHAILADLAAGSQGWVEWNLILDSIGGPNHLGNLCDASLLAVPHRAIGSDAPHTMPWEHTDHSSRFGRNVGDDRTREELNALGFPAELLDFGIVAQPLFYYMGHISRHVRPGSRAVPAFVNGTSAIFRLENLVAGGGMNDLARQGIELTVWPCEGSTRQQFYLKENHIQVLGHDWLGNPTKSCVGRHNSKDFLGIVTGPCTRSFAGKFDIVPIPDEPSYSNIFLLNGNKSAEEFCLVVQELENGGGANGLRSGSQVSAGTCSSEEAKWRYNIQTGEITSSYFEGGDVCMTTGWPFLQVGAFDTPNADNKKAIIVLNEAAQRANYIVKDGEKILLSGAIPAHSIQTILVD